MKPLGLNLSLAAAAALFLTVLFAQLSHPLIWEDESDTVMFGQRVYRYGYPKVHDGRNTVYGLKEKLEIGVDERTDAYTGAPWVGYYVGAVGVALATRVDDIYEKTLRLRLPFTLIGVAGLALIFLSVAPAFRDGLGSRRRAAVVYLLMLSVSISLILHLREARYYPIVIFLYGILLCQFIHHHMFSRLSYARYTAVSFATLFLLFNTFYPAFGAWCVGASLYLGLRALRGEGTLQDRLRRFLWDDAPVLLALAAVIPLLFYFDFALQAGRWFDQFDSTFNAYLQNVYAVFYNMVRFEFLGPALLVKLLLLLQIRRTDAAESDWLQARMPLVETSRFLATLIFSYWILVSRSPFIFERYFLSMGPLISSMLLLDTYLLAHLIGPRDGSRERSIRRLRTLVVGVTAVVLVLVVRLPDLSGRLYEMRHQYKGPADYFIPYILETYANPEDLVVATNYAEPVLMYYLGCRVTVGFYGPDLERDLQIQPDIIVPRPWKENMDALETLARRVPYRVKTFEIKNQRTNNIPALSPHTPGRHHHRYATVLAASPEQRMKILERVQQSHDRVE